MPLYNLKDKLKPILFDPFKLEQEIQTLTEENLDLIFGLEFVKSEFSLNNFRIDTLAYDRENKTFVIIEYKRGENFSVIDQGYSYLALMLDNKAEFILEYNGLTNQNLKRSDVDWSQSRILFVAPQFTTYQKAAIQFKDLPIDLWEIKGFENNLVSYEHIKPAKTNESIKTFSSKDNALSSVSKEVIVYTEEDHLRSAEPYIVELYEKLKDLILNLSEIELKPRKDYIAFILNSNFLFHKRRARKSDKCYGRVKYAVR
ncbi:hypothetical protein HOH45_05115 [bacterium]|jgi:hypothetical protein|nr:hypothetical protein [bacterium]